MKLIRADASYPIALDPRMGDFVGRREPDGTVRMMTPELWAAMTNDWAVTTSTPPDVAAMLATVRLLYAHGVYAYEFASVAVQHAFFTLEAAFAHRLDDHDATFGTLIQQAKKRGLIGDDEYDVLWTAARPLRNQFGHARQPTVMTPGMAVPMIRRVYATVATLWPDTEAAN